MMKEYAELKKKYDLPTQEEMNKYFQISEIEETSFPLKEIAKKISEKTSQFTHIFEEILNPEALGNLHESSTFTEDDKKGMLKIYRRLQYRNREKNILDIKYDEKEHAQFIKDGFKEWRELEPELEDMIKKLKGCWNKDKKTKLELGYFG